MSKHETWRTRKYWKSVGGLLIEEFRAVKGTKDTGKRLIDGVIVLGEKDRIQIGGQFDLENRDIIVLQTKASRIGMYLLGQALFSPKLLEKFKPKSIKSVAICGRGDIVMEELAAKENIEVVIIPNEKQ